MHHSTYEEHMTELDSARNEWYAAFMSKMQTMTDRLRE